MDSYHWSPFGLFQNGEHLCSSRLRGRQRNPGLNKPITTQLIESIYVFYFPQDNQAHVWRYFLTMHSLPVNSLLHQLIGEKIMSTVVDKIVAEQMAFLQLSITKIVEEAEEAARRKIVAELTAKVSTDTGEHTVVMKPRRGRPPGSKNASAGNGKSVAIKEVELTASGRKKRVLSPAGKKAMAENLKKARATRLANLSANAEATEKEAKALARKKKAAAKARSEKMKAYWAERKSAEAKEEKAKAKAVKDTSVVEIVEVQV